jgi:heavy metal efflux system protein
MANQIGSGLGATEAMFNAVEQQMRPILMMALSACIGLLPATISTGIGSQVQRPLATVIVGGMLVGPILLLVVVPALQSIFLQRSSISNARSQDEQEHELDSV